MATALNSRNNLNKIVIAVTLAIITIIITIIIILLFVAIDNTILPILIFFNVIKWEV